MCRTAFLQSLFAVSCRSDPRARLRVCRVHLCVQLPCTRPLHYARLAVGTGSYRLYCCDFLQILQYKKLKINRYFWTSWSFQLWNLRYPETWLRIGSVEPGWAFSHISVPKFQPLHCGATGREIFNPRIVPDSLIFMSSCGLEIGYGGPCRHRQTHSSS